MADLTADGLITYQQVLKGKTIDCWVQEVHCANCTENRWKYMPLKPGAFGYDNLAHSIVTAIECDNLDVNIMADAIHRGWIKNYTFWRDNKPYATNSRSKKPIARKWQRKFVRV